MTTNLETTSSNSDATRKEAKRIDLLFSKFAAFYGHLWRSQFKEDVFLTFAKKEWQDALGAFPEQVLTKAILNCRNFYELPPTLPQMVQCCRQIEKQMAFRVVKERHVPSNKALVETCLQRCKELLSQ